MCRLLELEVRADAANVRSVRGGNGDVSVKIIRGVLDAWTATWCKEERTYMPEQPLAEAA